MWIDAFKEIQTNSQSLEGRFISGGIAFRGSVARRSDPAANADAVLALLAHRSGERCELALVHPEPTSATARHALLAIAFAELIRNSVQQDRSGHAGVLYVTQHIVDAREDLANVRVKNQSIADVFRIGPPSPASAADWKSLFVVNPGRLLQGVPNARRLRALIIDASHPRTLAHLPELLAHPDVQHIPLRIVVAPPHESLLDRQGDRLIWMWDPPALSEIFSVAGKGSQAPPWAARTYWQTPPSAFDETLSAIEGRLLEATRLTSNRLPLELSEAWCVLTAVRNLCVPLEQAERAWRTSRNGVRLRDRLDVLRKSNPAAEGALRAFVAMHWSSILDDLESAYTALTKESLPQKFSLLVDALEEQSRNSVEPLRIVTSGEAEAVLIASNLADLDQGIRDSLDTGALEVVHQHEDARRVAVGDSRKAILTAPRIGRFRYLDLFPCHPIHLTAYPSEALRDRLRLERCYKRWAPFANGQRQVVGQRIDLKFTSSTQNARGFKPPAFELRGQGKELPPGLLEAPTGDLDLAWLEDDEEALGEHLIRVRDRIDGTAAGRTQIIDVDGASFEFSNRRLLDIYRPETDMLVRVSPKDVSPGEFLVILLDDRCESLFERLCDVAGRRRPMIDTLNLELWKAAKGRLLNAHFGNRRSIYDTISSKISVDYSALKSWFGNHYDEDGECIGPRLEEDFKQLALISGVYTGASDLKAAFKSIHTERVNRRRLGRQLRGAIRALAKRHASASGQRTAATLDVEVEEVMHALDLREVSKIKLLS